jgi:Protein of unknown function (DUF2530)
MRAIPPAYVDRSTRAAYPGSVPTDEPKKLRQIRPLDPPMVPFAVVGLAIWATLALALLPFRDSLAAHGHGNWIRICVAGFLVGLPGLAMMVVHDRNRRRRRAKASA